MKRPCKTCKEKIIHTHCKAVIEEQERMRKIIREILVPGILREMEKKMIFGE